MTEGDIEVGNATINPRKGFITAILIVFALPVWIGIGAFFTEVTDNLCIGFLISSAIIVAIYIAQKKIREAKP